MIDTEVSTINKLFGLGCNELRYENESEAQDKTDLTLSQIFDKDFLDKNFSFEQLNILNMFWQNRMAKEIKRIWSGVFVIETLNLWEDIIKGKKAPQLRSKALKNILYKKEILREISKYLFTIIRERYSNQIIDEEIDKQGYIKINVKGEIDSICRNYRENYRRRFQGELYESENDLLTDFEIEYRAVNILESIYRTKDKVLSSQLYSLIKAGKIKNFGIIKESQEQYGKILIGIDAEGFNMPLRLHMNTQDIIEYFKARKMRPVIQTYEGAEDFSYRDGRNIPTFLLLPLSKKQKKFLNEKAKDKNAPYFRYISHLRFLANNDKFPSHLKDTDGKRRERTYINIETGEEGSLDQISGEEKNVK